MWLNYGELATTLNGFTCEGGQFVVVPYKVYIDFRSCDGIAEIIWRGNKDHHRTLPSRTAGNFTRIGTSCQISNRLVKAITKAHQKKEVGKDVNNKYRNVDKLYQQYSRRN
jgi:hypothetical protein